MPIIFISLCVLLVPLMALRMIAKLYRHLSSDGNLKGKVVLITGASSGIGEQLVYGYSKRGAYLAIVARRGKQLEMVAQKAREFGCKDVLPIQADVSVLKDCERFVRETVDHFGRMDYLVNNAGISSVCPMEDVSDIAKVATLMDVNFWGSTYPTYFATPHLRKTRGNIIVNSSSTAKLQPPCISFYTASKAALLSFYESIRLELGPEISITIATLGYVDSEIIRGKHLSGDGTTVHDDSTVVDKMIGKFPIMSSRDCAEAIIDAACRKERHITEPKWFNAIFILKSFFPELVEFYYEKIFFERFK